MTVFSAVRGINSRVYHSSWYNLRHSLRGGSDADHPKGVVQLTRSMDTDLTWSDVEDVVVSLLVSVTRFTQLLCTLCCCKGCLVDVSYGCVQEAVSVRLLEDDGPLTDRPSKRQRLAPVSEHDPKPAPEVLPGLAWSGWGDLAAAMGLNSTDGPAFVHGVARLHAEQRRHYALPPKERAQSMPLVDVTLQRLSATLRRAQARSRCVCAVVGVQLAPVTATSMGQRVSSPLFSARALQHCTCLHCAMFMS